MKSKTILLATVCVCALALALVARAADEPAKVAGTWEMSMEGPQGTMTQTLTIEQKGEMIKGTIKGPRGETPFEGTVKGNTISFTVKRSTPRGEMTFEYTGTVEGDTIKGTMRGGQREREWTAKREKK